MTYKELNRVRDLRNRLTEVEQKLAALRLCTDSITPPFTRDGDGFTCLDAQPKGKSVASRPEILTTSVIEAETRVANTRARLDAEIPILTDKIQREARSEKDQTLLIHRYVNCKNFRDIGILMGLSEAHVYFTHRKILSYLLQKNLIVDNSR